MSPTQKRAQPPASSSHRASVLREAVSAVATSASRTRSPSGYARSTATVSGAPPVPCRIGSNAKAAAALDTPSPPTSPFSQVIAGIRPRSCSRSMTARNVSGYMPRKNQSAADGTGGALPFDSVVQMTLPIDHRSSPEPSTSAGTRLRPGNRAWPRQSTLARSWTLLTSQSSNSGRWVPGSRSSREHRYPTNATASRRYPLVAIRRAVRTRSTPDSSAAALQHAGVQK